MQQVVPSYHLVRVMMNSPDIHHNYTLGAKLHFEQNYTSSRTTYMYLAKCSSGMHEIVELLSLDST